VGDSAIETSKTALVLLDYQAGILGSLSGSGSLLDLAVLAIQRARELGVLVCHVRVLLTPHDRARISNRNKMFWRLAQSDFLAEGSAATAIPSVIEPLEDDLLITKTRVSAFSHTSLDESLRGRGIDTLAIGGVHTSGTVLSTVRDAADLDYRVLLLRELCADPNIDVHQFLFDRIFPSQAELIDLSAVRAGKMS
jgi:nicotinamidase-related amidase